MIAAPVQPIRIGNPRRDSAALCRPRPADFLDAFHLSGAIKLLPRLEIVGT
jgi:hypothetical protein